jgi:mRNA-degrading endonuclease HigB of HigAB toxin-antitoxin module
LIAEVVWILLALYPLNVSAQQSQQYVIDVGTNQNRFMTRLDQLD